MITVKLN